VSTLSEGTSIGTRVDVPKGLVVASAAAIAAGALVAAAGFAAAAVAALVTGRRWVDHLETPPMVTAKAQWHRLGNGVAAGARAWKATV
jgi:hypothetical protein